MFDDNKYNDDNFVGNDLESTNYDDSEYVFSMALTQRDNENSNLYTCNSCGCKSEDLNQCKKCNIKEDSAKKNDYREYAIQPQKDKIKEHMTEKQTQLSSASPSVLLISLIPYLVLIIFCYLLAVNRKELTMSSGFCIFFFPYMYISYVLIDYFVITGSPGGSTANL